MRSSNAVMLSVLAVTLGLFVCRPAIADTHTERQEQPSTEAAASTSDGSAEDSLPVSTVVQRVIQLTNRERLKVGLPALKRQKNLQSSASWMAEDMSEKRYFEHRDSTHRDMPARLSDFKYSGCHALGENIAMGQRTPEEVVDAWMNSPGHRANILSPHFSEIGVGYIPPSARNAYGYWVQDFGSRFDRCPVVFDSDSSRVRSCHVTLSIHGEDWVEQMRISNDGTNWTAWEPFRPIRDWSLEDGSGKRTVYIEIRQASRVERVQAAVMLEKPGPAQIGPGVQTQ